MKRHRLRLKIAKIFLLVIIVCLVGFAGWYGWHRKSAHSTDLTSTQKTTTAGQSTPEIASRPKALPGTPEAWARDRGNKTVIDPAEKVPTSKDVTIDFSLCSKGFDSFSFGPGTTSFYFKGIELNTCHFYMGTEIENPDWDGYLDKECYVPTDHAKEFSVTKSGGNLDFVTKYCQ